MTENKNESTAIKVLAWGITYGIFWAGGVAIAYGAMKYVVHKGDDEYTFKEHAPSLAISVGAGLVISQVYGHYKNKK